MAEINAALVKQLREKSGAGIMDCKSALKECDGDIEKASDFLRKKGLATAAKRAGRAMSEGVIESYIHMGGKLGVLVEVNCETDFVARSDSFREFAHEIALQIAAASPLYVTEEEIPQEELDHEAEVAAAKAREEGKPDKIIPRIVEGYLKKYKDENVLLNQAYIRDDSLTIQKLLTQTIGSTGENLVIRRFERWALGEGAEETEDEE